MAEQGRDGVVLLAAQAVAPAAGDDVHGVAHVEQEGVRGIHPAVRAVGEPRLGHRREHGHVAQAAVGLLELGLDGLREVALALVARGDGLDELGQPLARVAAPVVGDGGAGGGDELLVAGERREVEQPDGGPVLSVRAVGPDLVLEANVERRAFVATSLPDWPGWNAVEGGRPIPLESVNHAFVGLWLPPGRHEVRLSYRPFSWSLGLWSLLAGAIACVVLASARGGRAS